MFQAAEVIARRSSFHIEGADAAYRDWLDRVARCEDAAALLSIWKHAHLHDWHLDLIRYPLLKRIDELVQPHPMLYLYLQIAASHTPWATLEEVDGRYLFEAFFFFPAHTLTLCERALFLAYQAYPASLVREALERLRENSDFEEALARKLQGVSFHPEGEPVKLPEAFLAWLDRKRASLYRSEDLRFVDALRLKPGY